MLALLDGDIYAYRCAAASENDPEDIAIFRVRDSVEQTLASVGADAYQVWLSDKRENNFRRLIYPEYKANRTKPDPVHLAAVKQYLVEEWQANTAVGEEADDRLGIKQAAAFFGDLIDEPVYLDTIICSIDKDLKQIPGRHFNFVKQEFDEVSPLEGIRWFYKQALIGDIADNIIGVYGIGKKRAGDALDPLSNPVDMFNCVLGLYGGDYNRLVTNLKVLWIRQKPDEMWEVPNECKLVQD